MKPNLGIFIEERGETAPDVAPVIRLQARVTNKGKLAHSLEAGLLIENMTDGIEKLYWQTPQGKSLTIPRLSKWDKAILPICHRSVIEDYWTVSTAQEDTRILFVDQSYDVAVFIYYEPSDTKAFSFKLRIDSDKQPHWTDLKRMRI